MKKFATPLAALAILTLASAAGAAPIILTGTNGVQATTAEITLDASNVIITLTNDTALTQSAGDLLTKFTIDIAGLTGGTAISGTSLAARDVASDGSFIQTGGVDLLSLNTWTASVSGDTITLVFNPDAEYALIGADTAGNYSAANGSIKGNNGHNPFAFGNVSFQFNATGVTQDSALSDANFYFGTDFSTDIPGGGVPEPASLGILALGAVGLLARRRKA